MSTDEGIFVLPETAVVRPGMPFFMPDWSDNWVFKPFVGIMIGRLGKAVQNKFASRYWQESRIVLKATPGAGKGIPEGFDGSIMMSQDSMSFTTVNYDCDTLPFNGKLPERVYSGSFEFKVENKEIDAAIAQVSTFFTIHTGDIVLLPIKNEVVMKAVHNTRLKLKAGTDVVLNHKVK